MYIICNIKKQWLIFKIGSEEKNKTKCNWEGVYEYLHNYLKLFLS